MNNRPIRVMQLASNPEYGGLERHVFILIKALQELGDVEPYLAVFHDGQLVDEVKELGVPVEVVTLRWVFDPTAITRLARLMHNWKIDCLHSHGYKANVIGALSARWVRIPSVVRTEHPMEPYRGFDRIKIQVYEALDTFAGNRLTDQIITVSDDLQRHLAHRYPYKNLVTIYNGIPTPETQHSKTTQKKRESLGFTESTPLIGIVGRLMPVKRHTDFIQAAALITKQKPDLRFLIIGDGPLLGPLQLEVASLGLNDIVHFLGFRSDVIELISMLDLLVLPSEYEGIPYTVLEAMSLGTPVVATSVGGLPEIIEDGVTGLLVKPKNPELLAQACLKLLGNPERCRQLSAAGQKRCAECFSDARMAKAIRNIYHEVALRNGVRPFVHEPETSGGKVETEAMTK